MTRFVSEIDQDMELVVARVPDGANRSHLLIEVMQRGPVGTPRSLAIAIRDRDLIRQVLRAIAESAGVQCRIETPMAPGDKVGDPRGDEWIIVAEDEFCDTGQMWLRHASGLGGDAFAPRSEVVTWRRLEMGPGAP